MVSGLALVSGTNGCILDFDRAKSNIHAFASLLLNVELQKYIYFVNELKYARFESPRA